METRADNVEASLYKYQRDMVDLEDYAYQYLIPSRYSGAVSDLEKSVNMNSSTFVSLTMFIAERCLMVLAAGVIR